MHDFILHSNQHLYAGSATFREGSLQAPLSSIREETMIEIIIGSLVGSFMYDNIEFFSTAKKQIEEGATWHMSGPQDANPSVPNIPIKNPITGKDTVIWVLE